MIKIQHKCRTWLPCRNALIAKCGVKEQRGPSCIELMVEITLTSIANRYTLIYTVVSLSGTTEPEWTCSGRREALQSSCRGHQRLSLRIDFRWSGKWNCAAWFVLTLMKRGWWVYLPELPEGNPRNDWYAESGFVTIACHVTNWLLRCADKGAFGEKRPVIALSFPTSTSELEGN